MDDWQDVEEMTMEPDSRGKPRGRLGDWYTFARRVALPPWVWAFVLGVSLALFVRWFS
jgi:hypothetical protein